jgi:hypothetical protein
MKIELRNLKVYPEMSEETTAFTGDLVIDGIPIGRASNTGKGEMNSFFPRSMEAKAKVEEAEKYCESLPPAVIRPWKDEEPMSLPMTLDFYISLLVEKQS